MSNVPFLLSFGFPTTELKSSTTAVKHQHSFLLPKSYGFSTFDVVQIFLELDNIPIKGKSHNEQLD